MSHHPVPLNELAVAVQSAVEQALAKHGAVSIDKIWVGFVAPDNIATLEAAGQIATILGKEGGVQGQPSMGQLAGAPGAAQPAAVPHRIIGLIYKPR